jgi:hypothetical protein
MLNLKLEDPAQGKTLLTIPIDVDAEINARTQAIANATAAKNTALAMAKGDAVKVATANAAFDAAEARAVEGYLRACAQKLLMTIQACINLIGKKPEDITAKAARDAAIAQAMAQMPLGSVENPLG